MSILERFSTIIKANINDLLDRAEDPAKMMDQYMRQLMSDLGVDIDPNALVDELETSKKQLLEIAKALHANAKLFILDEPTNNLDIQSIDIITATIRNYTGTVIAISHDNYFIREIGIEQRIVLS